MWDLILKAIYLMSPSYFANMAPVICRGIFNNLATPIDFNKQLFGKPILGRNKTLRGIFFGLIFAIITAFIQSLLYRHEIFRQISILDYNNWLIIGILLGGGTLIGDIVKSFIKRRLSIAPGNSLIIFDQIDFVIGSIVFISILVKLSIKLIITILVISYILNVIVNYISFNLKIRKDKW